MGMLQDWREFRKYRQEDNREERSLTLEEILLSAGYSFENITKEQALNIPAVSSSVEMISNTIASLPILLYKEKNGKVEEVKGDNRVTLLNDETGDTLDGFQFKKALVVDYLLDGNGYAYINKERNNVKSLHYVNSDNLTVSINTDPIFKSYDILVNGNTYRDFEFVKILRKTKDGAKGIGIIEENNEILSVVYNSLLFENRLIKRGGNKKGFLQSEHKISQESMDALKSAWNKLYQNDTENVMILNEGLNFKESSATSVELQLNENKKTNSNEINKIFNVPESIINGTASIEVYENFIKIAILPILKVFETAINRDLLLSNEKNESFYFAFDTSELLKADVEKRFKAYEMAIKNGFMQVDEVRYKEDLEPLGLDFIKLGLQDVLYNPKTKEIYTPNTNKTGSIENTTGTPTSVEGGEKNEN